MAVTIKTPEFPWQERSKNKKAVITGADGFIGSVTTKLFLDIGWQVLALDSNDQPKRLQEHPNLIYLQWDMMDYRYGWDQTLSQYFPTKEEDNYSVFVHFAWAGSSGNLRSSMEIQMENAYATAACVELAQQFGCQAFVGAGSLMEYEVAQAAHYSNAPTSVNYYGLAKLSAHYMAKQAAKTHGIDFIWGIITNAYGPGETAPRFINTVLRKIIHNEPLEFNSNGLQNYDFVYIDDVAMAFYLMALVGKNNHEYVIGSSEAKELYKFVLEIIEVTKYNKIPQFNMANRIDCELNREVFSTFEISTETGWHPRTSFADGIAKTLEWLKNE